MNTIQKSMKLLFDNETWIHIVVAMGENVSIDWGIEIVYQKLFDNEKLFCTTLSIQP